MKRILSEKLNPNKDTFNHFQDLIEKLKRNFVKSGHAFVETGLEVEELANKLKINEGLGYTKSGQKVLLSAPNEIDIKLEKISILYLKPVTIKSKKLVIKDNNNNLIYSGSKFEFDSTIPLILEVDEIEENPYSNNIFDDPNILVLGFFKNSVFTSLNLKSQINNFKKGTVLLYSGSEFKDFITLENFKTADSFYKKYLKIGNCFKINEQKPFKLFDDHLPPIHFNGTTNYAGDHTHDYSKWTGWTGGQVTPDPYWFGEELKSLNKAGNHSHNFKLSFKANNQEGLVSTPEYYSLIPIERV